MKRLLNVLLIVILTLFITACSKSVMIVLDPLENVELTNYVQLDNDALSDDLESVVLTLNDQEVETDYQILDGGIKFRPKSDFKANAEYVLTIKYAKKTTYLLNLSTISNLEQALIELEENFFILPDSDYDYVEANNMKKRILNISPKILMSMYRADVKMKLVNGPITDEPELNYLRGVVPRGWEGTGMTWDDVPGAGGYEMPIARIGYSEPGIWNNHDTINLELHELAHTVDNYISGDLSEPISFSEQFISIWESEVEHVLNYYYFIEYPEEYFAETFAMYYLSEDSKAKLKALAPMTYDYIKDLDKFTNIKDFD